MACGLLLCAAASAQAQKALTHSAALTGLGGCDAPGYPLTICRPGSYKLTTDLKVPSDSDGVEIQVSLVTVDLNGFASAGSMVLANVVRANGRFGLLLGSTAGYGTNVLTDNPGEVDNPGNVLGGAQMGHNICDGAACP